jgi:hypothetical protein
MTEEDANLIAEKLARYFDAINNSIRLVNTNLDHHINLSSGRLDAIEKVLEDHEKRIRSAHDSTTRINALVALATGGGLLSLINLLRELIR